MKAPTTESVRSQLAYDAATGIFTWLITRAGCRAGTVAGWARADGYTQICIDGKRYRAHRLAWLYSHGEWPTGDIDHLNGDRSDNRLENLRDVSRFVNAQNLRRGRRDNRSGLLGVSPNGNLWRATIQVNRRQLFLGNFRTPEEASTAYVAAKRKFHPGNTL